MKVDVLSLDYLWEILPFFVMINYLKEEHEKTLFPLGDTVKSALLTFPIPFLFSFLTETLEKLLEGNDFAPYNAPILSLALIMILKVFIINPLSNFFIDPFFGGISIATPSALYTLLKNFHNKQLQDPVEKNSIKWANFIFRLSLSISLATYWYFICLNSNRDANRYLIATYSLLLSSVTTPILFYAHNQYRRDKHVPQPFESKEETQDPSSYSQYSFKEDAFIYFMANLGFILGLYGHNYYLMPIEKQPFSVGISGAIGGGIGIKLYGNLIKKLDDCQKGKKKKDIEIGTVPLLGYQKKLADEKPLESRNRNSFWCPRNPKEKDEKEERKPSSSWRCIIL